MTNRQDENYLILIPIFNDWESLQILIIKLNEVCKLGEIQAEILVVDDASTRLIPKDLITSELAAIFQIHILELKRNLGHQRAITIGLAYAEEHLECKGIIIMDGDGEDHPKDVLRLINKCSQINYEKVIFANRTKRSESKIFKFFYIFYKLIYKLLTGQTIGIGNFSIIPKKSLSRVVSVSEIWNHYASGILKAKIPYLEIPSQRSYRYKGKSKMNFVSLVTHGLSAISVHGEVVGTRLIVICFCLILLSIISIITLIYIKFVTSLAIPGWTSYLVAIFSVIALQAFMISLLFGFIILISRNNTNFIPKRDYQHFILNYVQLLSK